MTHNWNREAPVGEHLEHTPIRRRPFFAGAVLTLAVVAAACGGNDSSGAASASGTGTAITTQSPSATASSEPSESAAAGEIQGGWDGTWTSTSDPGVDGTFHIDFTRSGAVLNGSISITDTPCITTGTITGTLDGDNIEFGAVQGTQNIAYTGTISGSSMSGTYAAPQCGNGTGDWEATKA